MDTAGVLIVGVSGVGGDAGVSGVPACLPSPLEMAHAGARPVAVAAVRRLDASIAPISQRSVQLAVDVPMDVALSWCIHE